MIIMMIEWCTQMIYMKKKLVHFTFSLSQIPVNKSTGHRKKIIKFQIPISISWQYKQQQNLIEYINITEDKKEIKSNKIQCPHTHTHLDSKIQKTSSSSSSILENHWNLIEKKNLKFEPLSKEKNNNIVKNTRQLDGHSSQLVGQHNNNHYYQE